jgi:hypothetical protein
MPRMSSTPALCTEIDLSPHSAPWARWPGCGREAKGFTARTTMTGRSYCSTPAEVQRTASRRSELKDGHTLEDIVHTAFEKRSERGGFDKRVSLENLTL